MRKKSKPVFILGRLEWSKESSYATVPLIRLFICTETSHATVYLICIFIRTEQAFFAAENECGEACRGSRGGSRRRRRGSGGKILFSGANSVNTTGSNLLLHYCE